MSIELAFQTIELERLREINAELLAAAKDLVRFGDDIASLAAFANEPATINVKCFNALRAAIAKAEGEPS